MTTDYRCPRCGSHMIYRNGDNGRYIPFYGCSRWKPDGCEGKVYPDQLVNKVFEKTPPDMSKIERVRTTVIRDNRPKTIASETTYASDNVKHLVEESPKQFWVKTLTYCVMTLIASGATLWAVFADKADNVSPLQVSPKLTEPPPKKETFVPVDERPVDWEFKWERPENVHYLKDLKTEDLPKCPRCGKTMVVRENRKTGEPFFGCSQFPKCRGTKTIKYPNKK